MDFNFTPKTYINKSDLDEYENQRKEADKILSKYEISYLFDISKDVVTILFFYKDKLIDKLKISNVNDVYSTYRYLLERSKDYSCYLYEPERTEKRTVLEYLKENPIKLENKDILHFLKNN